MLDWITLIFIIGITIFTSINGSRVKERRPKSKIRFYAGDIGFGIVVLALFYLIHPNLLTLLKSNSIAKGIYIDPEWLPNIYIVFLLPILSCFIPKNNLYPADVSTAKELFGFPILFFPDNGRQMFFFLLYIVTGVLFEEVLYRQLLLYSLNQTLGLQGDLLVIIAAIVFAIIHFYQGWAGVLSSLFIGLLLGKILLIKENLLYPVVLHFILNATVLVLAFRRINDLKKLDSAKA